MLSKEVTGSSQGGPCFFIVLVLFQKLFLDKDIHLVLFVEGVLKEVVT